MGTPEFAVATLGSLLMNGANIVGVVTAPDKPSGRGRKITKSAVKKFAEFSNIPIIMQPLDLKDPDFVTFLPLPEGRSGAVTTPTMLNPFISNEPRVVTANSGVPMNTILRFFIGGILSYRFNNEI